MSALMDLMSLKASVAENHPGNDLSPASYADVEKTPVMGEAAAPDIPSIVGLLMAASYAAIMLAFLVGFAHSADATMMVVISSLYALIYVAVPAIFLKIEGASGRVGLKRFMRLGVQTATGPLSGGGALVQMLLVPGAITLAATGIGLVAAFNR